MYSWDEWEDMKENETAVQAFISEWLTAEDYDKEMKCYEICNIC